MYYAVYENRSLGSTYISKNKRGVFPSSVDHYTLVLKTDNEEEAHAYRRKRNEHFDLIRR